MEKDSYISISGQGNSIYREKGSKFIGLAFSVNDEEEIREILESLKKKYHDARHHCYAWRLGPGNNRSRANDDGEPSNSAGKPILGQIDAFGLHDVLVVVVRYFGGTLLGVGGLIQAYKTAARDSLSTCQTRECFVSNIFQLEFRYEKMNKVMKVIRDMDLEQFDQDFKLDCRLKIRVRQSFSEQFLSSFESDNSIIIKPIDNS